MKKYLCLLSGMEWGNIMLSKRKRNLTILLCINASLLFSAILFKLVFDTDTPITMCKLYEATSLPCPACGGSRAVYALLEFKIASAFVFYPPLFVGIFIILHFDILNLFHILKPCEKAPSIPSFELILIPASIISFFFLRLFLLICLKTNLLEIAESIPL